MRTRLMIAGRVGEEPVAPAHREGPDRVLPPVVVELDRAVLQDVAELCFVKSN